MDIYNYFKSDPSLFFECIFTIFATFLFLFIFIQIDRKKNINNSLQIKSIQNIHYGHISRLGGLILLISYIILLTYITFKYDNSFLLNILLFGLPFIIIILIEDFFQNISPVIRFVFLLLSSLIFCIYGIKSLPIIEIPFVDLFINHPIISVIFYTLCITAFINGVNFVDGTNGLAALTILSCQLCLLFLALILSDFDNAKIIVYSLSILTAFIFLNYPFGKIFLGDLGAYFIGWITAIMTIKIMVDNPEIPNWGAVTILSYPIIEVLFSFFRKILNKKNPFYPDREHLHLKLFFILESKIKNNLYANSLVAPFLALIWLTPLVILPWVYENKFLVIISVVVQIIIYYFFYILIPKK